MTEAENEQILLKVSSLHIDDAARRLLDAARGMNGLPLGDRVKGLALQVALLQSDIYDRIAELNRK